MRTTSENKVLKYNSRFLGTVIFLFGFLAITYATLQLNRREG